MLTFRQRQLLRYITNYLDGHDGVSPSFDEMARELKLKSKSGVFRLVDGLEERGFIKRLPHKARAIEVVKQP